MVRLSTCLCNSNNCRWAIQKKRVIMRYFKIPGRGTFGLRTLIRLMPTKQDPYTSVTIC